MPVVQDGPTLGLSTTLAWIVHPLFQALLDAETLILVRNSCRAEQLFLLDTLWWY